MSKVYTKDGRGNKLEGLKRMGARPFHERVRMGSQPDHFRIDGHLSSYICQRRNGSVSGAITVVHSVQFLW